MNKFLKYIFLSIVFIAQIMAYEVTILNELPQYIIIASLTYTDGTFSNVAAINPNTPYTFNTATKCTKIAAVQIVNMEGWIVWYNPEPCRNVNLKAYVKNGSLVLEEEQ